MKVHLNIIVHLLVFTYIITLVNARNMEHIKTNFFHLNIKSCLNIRKSWEYVGYWGGSL